AETAYGPCGPICCQALATCASYCRGGGRRTVVADTQRWAGKVCMSPDRNGHNLGNEAAVSGKITRRRVLRWLAVGSAIGLAAAMLPTPWRSAFGQAKPVRLGTVQPLTGVAAYGGKTSLVGVQMAVDQINKSGGINGRPIELFIGDDESKPDTGRRAVEK